MSKESLDRVWAPKAEGALRLHHASAAAELDWWIVFSSMAALLGSPGQAAYACASAWVDALVSWRAAKGLPAAAINWGPWSEVGLAQALTGSVLDPISPPEGIEALEALLASGRGRTGVARLRADRVIAAFPEIRGSGYFAQLVEEFDFADDGGDWSGPEVLRDCDPAEACKIVSERMRLRVAAIMGYADQSAADPAVPLVELGMDSLMAVRIRNTARADFGVEPPVALLLEGASLNDVTADLIRQLGFAAHDSNDRADEVRDRAQLRAAARQGAALRRKRGQRV
jgi:phthiocerol/phenolphthiocerol synthesis type-I polyketide synthase D